MRSRRIAGPAGLVLVAGAALVAGCTTEPVATFRDPAVPAGSFQLVAFDSCGDALAKLKRAAKEYVGPWGFGGGTRATMLGGPAQEDAAGPQAAAGAENKAAAPAPGGNGPSYSGTNTHEAGVDEPDLVKTDGRRILTVSQGLLRVVDAQARRVTGRLDLGTDGQDPIRWTEADLLLHGDRALVLVPGGHVGAGAPVPEGIVADGPAARPGGPGPDQLVGPRLLLVDLAGGSPSLAGSYTIDGELVDARQVGGSVRVVVRSGPRLRFPSDDKKTDAQRIAANRSVIEAAGPDEWLPRYESTAGDKTTKGRVSCAALSRPATYTGTSMVTVLSFDLGSSRLGNGEPVTVVADGNTVYGNGQSLYVANDQRWQAVPFDGPEPRSVEQRTELYKFDTSRAGPPRYVAAGSVPGWLINQYAMSEWDGHLRVATTVGQEWGRNARSESTVYVLRHQGQRLVETGKVTGLGKGERIYAVRFVGHAGYVVTFRQTDPLYTVDLRNPSAPRVTGELKITGYSAYLHPAGDTRLLGIGQEATEQGRVQGTQVSLFDVADLAQPTRIAQYHVRYGQSEAEFDPHAFLYWPATGLLVVPLTVHARGGQPGGAALVLRVRTGELAEIGTVSHPMAADPTGGLPGQIRRSLVIDDVLWTVSAAGLKASDVTSLATLAWIPFGR